MAPRRSLTNALELTPEKLAFIRGESATDSATPVAGISPDATAAAAAGSDPPAATRDAHRRLLEDRSRNHPSRPAAESAVPSLLGEVLVPVTTRIRPETANALRRAYLEQKLAGRRPATQQEIIEEALVAWLDKHGFH